MKATNLLYILAAFLLIHSPAHSDEILTVGWEQYPPQQMINKQGELTGIDIEIAKAVLSEAGFTVTFKNIPWQRMLNIGLKNGEVDVALNAALRDDRKDFVYFSSTAYLPSQSALYILPKNKDKFENIDALADFTNTQLTVGVTRGIYYSPQYTKLLDNPDFAQKLYPSTKEEQNIRMLLAERVDGILMERYIYEDILKKIAPNKKVTSYSELDFNTPEAGSFFMFSKATMNQEQVNRINKALEKLKANNTINKLIDKHLYQQTP